MKLFVPIDIETTGLSPQDDYILEIAWVVCDDKLNELTPRYSFIVEHENAWGDVFAQIRSNEFVRNMHQESGLAGQLLAAPAYTLTDIYTALSMSIFDATTDCPSESVHMLGFSVDFDRAFLSRVFPGLFEQSKHVSFHHRVYDLSSIKLAYEIAGLEIPQIENNSKHRAADDVNEVLEFARAIRNEMKEFAL